jgi:hypothetical protein
VNGPPVLADVEDAPPPTPDDDDDDDVSTGSPPSQEASPAMSASVSVAVSTIVT